MSNVNSQGKGREATVRCRIINAGRLGVARGQGPVGLMRIIMKGQAYIPIGGQDSGRGCPIMIYLTTSINNG